MDKESWVEHNTGLGVKNLGTVFQPVIKKKKSVTKLTNIEDLNSKVTKYCLATQEQNSEGEIENYLYKVGFKVFKVRLEYIYIFRYAL